MQELIQKAGLTPDILKDPAKRAQAIDAYNAKAGGLRDLMKHGKLEIASTHPIPNKLTADETGRFLRFAAAGKRIPIIFAAGRATRMQLPRYFDKLGIGGLTGRILKALHAPREGSDAQALIAFAAAGSVQGPEDLSFIQRQLFQYRYQMENNFRASDVSFQGWLSKACFAVVANEENKSAMALQMAAVRFAGLKPENVYIVVQPEEGGLEVLRDGTLQAYDRETWPEGHGKPFLDMRGDPNAAYRLNKEGHLLPLNKTLVLELMEKGVERAVFAQVNDLHLLEDMAHAERWLAADTLIQKGAGMVMEMVENALKQKGGGIFVGAKGQAVMRDTLAMKSPDLEPYSVPKSLSRMFYELTLKGLSQLESGALPAYLTERKNSAGDPVLTREYYSGDASGALDGQAMQCQGYELDTFKMQSRIPHALEAFSRQDLQKDYNLFINRLK